ncbi:unnamed protein product [Euphydryas editha]|uniref:Thioredoxin domain-containing protein 11 n=1 Tax=Euphydryas editha TaxID=104508 RepID=A0AAU9V4G3_EUPED|nr:unnamed protein product [Euphydryas editha]
MFPTADTEDISQVTSYKEKSSLSSDERESPESSQVAKQNNNRELTLNMLFKEVVFCIALALTTYGALHNTPSKISKVPQAVKFFNSESIVKDWHKGQLSNALAKINSEDLSFLMYYAPWDAESQYVRGEFDKAANILRDRVHFSAINCWNPGSECRLQHNKIPSWPILMAYTVTSRGVLYKGPRNAESMVKFLEMLMRPLEKVSNTEDLVYLLSICDAVALGFTPLTDTSRYYNVWYNVALKSREFDTIGEICFAAVTSKELAIDLGVERVPNVRLMLWNDTKEFKPEDNNQSWNETYVMHWVLQNFVQPVIRIIPLWQKSYTFERYADGKPILILFTPLNPLYEQLPSYALLREVAMEYYNCKNNESNQWTTELIKLQQVQRLLYQQKNFLKFCQEYKFKKPVKKLSPLSKRHLFISQNKYIWNNMTQKNKKSGILNFLLNSGLTSKAVDSSNDNMWSTLGFLEQCGLSKSFPAEKSFYEMYEKCHSIEDQLNNDTEDEERGEVETTMLPYEDDPLSAENLIQDNIKHFCRLMKFANKLSPPVSPARVTSGNITHLHGLACKTNSTLYMMAIDSILNYHFAEALGIDIKNKKDMTAVVILDSKYESQYVMTEEYSAKSLRDFIHNFTRKNLKRTLRTYVKDANNTHFFRSTGNTQVDDRNASIVHITDLTTRTFKKFVRTPGTTALVAVCGGGCAAHVSRALAQAARVLSACGVRARPARLDALRHDLPWHYTAHHYPAVLVFPAGPAGPAGGGEAEAEAESRALPSGERVSGGAVLALALRSLRAPHQLRVRLALCAQAKTINEKRVCLKDIREHIDSVICRNLKYWRRTDIQDLKAALLKRLQHLQKVSLYMNLLHVTDLSENNATQELLLLSLNNMSTDWDIDESILRRNVIPSSINR